MGRFDEMEDAAEERIVTIAPAPPSKSSKTGKDTHVQADGHSHVQGRVHTPVAEEEYYFADSVRRAIRWPGKNTAHHKITDTELERQKAAVRFFEDKGQYTDRTQIMRAATAYMLDDLERKGEDSLLAEIMDRINNY